MKKNLLRLCSRRQREKLGALTRRSPESSHRSWLIQKIKCEEWSATMPCSSFTSLNMLHKGIALLLFCPIFSSLRSFTFFRHLLTTNKIFFFLANCWLLFHGDQEERWEWFLVFTAKKIAGNLKRISETKNWGKRRWNGSVYSVVTNQSSLLYLHLVAPFDPFASSTL